MKKLKKEFEQKLDILLEKMGIRADDEDGLYFQELFDGSIVDDEVKALKKAIAQEIQTAVKKEREEKEALKHLCYWLAGLYQVNFDKFNLKPNMPKWKEKAFMIFSTVQTTKMRIFVKQLSQNKYDPNMAIKAMEIFTTKDTKDV